MSIELQSSFGKEKKEKRIDGRAVKFCCQAFGLGV